MLGKYSSFTTAFLFTVLSASSESSNFPHLAQKFRYFYRQQYGWLKQWSGFKEETLTLISLQMFSQCVWVLKSRVTIFSFILASLPNVGTDSFRLLVCFGHVLCCSMTSVPIAEVVCDYEGKNEDVGYHHPGSNMVHLEKMEPYFVSWLEGKIWGALNVYLENFSFLGD